MICNEIKTLLANKAINRNRLQLLRYNDALEMIKICEKNHIEVLGIDAFVLLEGGFIRPCMENSVDFSSPFHPSKMSAHDFMISHKNDDMVFEIVI